MNSGMEIEFRNLSINLGGNKVLDNINLTIEKGTIHCFIGPNGGGKSTLAKSLLSLIDYDGEIILKYDDKKVIGYVPQNLEFDKSMPITVEDFLKLIYHKKPVFFGKKEDEQINEMLIKIGMFEKKDRLLGTLSGGERQRILLAQALYPKPNLLILDEPFTGIDAVAEKYFLDLMIKLKNEGITIIWIHHNLKQIIGIADKVSCIKEKLIFTGNPEIELKDERIMEIFSL